MVLEFCQNKVVSHLDYCTHFYISLTLGFCCAQMVADFWELEPEEDVDIEVVLDTKMKVIGIEPQRHMGMDTMARELYKLEIEGENSP